MMDSNGQGRESSLGLRAWALWVLAGAAGGAVTGATGYLLEALALVVLLGVALGVAQALVIRRYLPRGTAPLWAVASSFGWFFGWFVLGMAIFFLRISSLGLDLQIGSILFAGVQVSGAAFLDIAAVCAVFGAFQAAVLLALGGRPFLPLSALWVAASALGGVLAPVGALPVDVIGAKTSAGGGGDFVNLFLGPMVGTAAAGALYSTVTGVVLVMTIQRLVPQEASD